ncbi:MAG: Rrf2 family transcriptional regulator [Calditrichia bacterium]
MMLLSKTCDYGLRALLFIATQKNKQYVPIRTISENLDISFHFLTKILQILTQNQILTSFRGPHGGVALSRPANALSLMEVILAIDGPGKFERCILGLNHCNDENPCPLHNEWKVVRDNIQSIFKNTTIEDLAQKIETNGFRLTDIVE